MKKDFVIDCLGFGLLKGVGSLLRLLPVRVCLAAGAFLGDVFYLLDARHRALVYCNIKTALGRELSSARIRQHCRGFYRSYGQNLMEIFLISRIDAEYVRKYISIEGRENIAKAFSAGKGVLLVGVHEGSWEISNIISAGLGFNFNLFVRDQKYPLLAGLLNSYRRQKGCKIIERGQELRRLIQVLRDNEAVGISVDQGGKTGLSVQFFGREASMSQGAVKLALKYGAAIVPVVYARVRGPYTRIIVQQPFELIKSGDEPADLRDNLQRLVRVFEEAVRDYPQEYLWAYKIWKYGRDRKILVLSDGKAGHLKQSEGLAQIVKNVLIQKGFSVQIRKTEFKVGSFSRFLLHLAVLFYGKYRCLGRFWRLLGKRRLEAYNSLGREKYDVIISCGSSLAGLNLLLSRENFARSLVIMKPAWLSLREFDLAVIPAHDLCGRFSPEAGNIAVTSGALNTVNDGYLRDSASAIRPYLKNTNYGSYLGFLVGGDTKGFALRPGWLSAACAQLKNAAEELDYGLMISTSRRTSPEATDILREGFAEYPRTALLVIANEVNPPATVGGILALCGVIICTPESISMISEAASSGKYLVVVDCVQLPAKHRRFLQSMRSSGHLALVPPEDLGKTLVSLCLGRMKTGRLDDSTNIAGRLDKIL